MCHWHLDEYITTVSRVHHLSCIHNECTTVCILTVYWRIMCRWHSKQYIQLYLFYRFRGSNMRHTLLTNRVLLSNHQWPLATNTGSGIHSSRWRIQYLFVVRSNGGRKPITKCNEFISSIRIRFVKSKSTIWIWIQSSNGQLSISIWTTRDREYWCGNQHMEFDHRHESHS